MSRFRFFSFAGQPCGLCLLTALVSAFSLTAVLGNTYRRPCLLFLKLAAEQQVNIQVYFKIEGSFQEKYSEIKKTGSGDGLKSLYFTVPARHISALRIDPDADIRIVDMAIEGRHTVTIRPLNPSHLTALNNVEVVRTDRQGVQVKIKGADPQLSFDFFPSLPNHYGFRILPALALTCIFYCILQLLLFLFRPPAVRIFPAVTGRTRQNSRLFSAALRSLHLLFLFFGAAGLAGGVLLWHFEGKNSLGEDPGEHNFIPYPFDLSAQSVTFQRQEDGLPLAGLLYTTEGDGKQPAVLLLHGNYPQGSNVPLYRVLGAELARRGYVVLAMDFAGHGKSADPFIAGNRRGFALHEDAVSGLQFLRQQSGVDENRLHLVGHSMGADPAISVGSTAGAVRSMALIGPPRMVHERFHFQPDVDFFWYWAHHVRKTVYNKHRFPDWFTKEVWRQQILERDMVHFLPYFSGWRHKPVLFLDGERESGPEKRFLQWYYCRTSWPKEYHTLKRANHDCNVTTRNNRIYYDPAVMDQTVDILDQWFRQVEDQPQMPPALLLNLLRRLFAIEMLKKC
ncbi:MAG: alpha/beta hydrolase [Candidatus Electrothrix sp. YB6]